MPRRLTAKQEHFSRLIALEGVNQSEAYRRSYEAGNMKPETIWQRAYELANKGDVAARVTELREPLEAKAAVDANEILEELKTVALSDLSDLVSWSEDGVTIKDSKELSPELTKLVSEVVETRHKDGTISVKIKLHDKLAAINQLNKTLGLYRDDSKDRDNRPIQVTHVTVVLASGSETRVVERPDAIEGESRVLPEDENGPTPPNS